MKMILGLRFAWPALRSATQARGAEAADACGGAKAEAAA